MKKIVLFLIAILCFCMGSCGSNSGQVNVDAKTSEIVGQATTALLAKWTAYYNDEMAEGVDGDGYLEIKNVRVITIKENTVEMFKDIKYVVEYVLYSDYLGGHPYYSDYRTDDCVSIDKNGNATVSVNLFTVYYKKTWSYKFADTLIENIDDCGGLFNKVYNLKRKAA